MRYIDRTGKARNEKGESKEIRSMGDLTKEACRKAESLRLGVMKTSRGAYKVIRACGLGYEMNAFGTLKEVDTYIKSI